MEEQWFCASAQQQWWLLVKYFHQNTIFIYSKEKVRKATNRTAFLDVQNSV